ncbi:MAG: hypothetical protein HY035_08635 [Nitrospirae bacterium]|nr:hypothetical protein [Nitrospirota bacterium]MBI3378445.1 hypothetical protein [Nitrospirota bacterium]
MKILPAAFVLIAILVLSSTAGAEVIFFDDISLKGEPVMLKAVTKGKIFSKGGQLVEFYVDGKSIGRSLSGGDGAAFKEFRAEKTGLHKVSVVSGKDKDSGFLLSLKKGAEIVFIDVEGSMFAPLSGKPMKDSRKVIKAIAKRFPVVYLQAGVLDIRALKKLLKENEFTEAPLLPWREGNAFEEADKKGLKIKFVIGGKTVIESAKEFKPKAFSFNEVEGAEEVKGWEEIGKKMRLVIK